MHRRWNAGWAFILVVVALLAPAAAAADEDDAPPPAPLPSLSAAADPVSMEVKKVYPWNTRSTQGVANGSVLLSNAGGGQATGVKLQGYYADGHPVTFATPSAAPSPRPSPTTVSGNDSVPIDISFVWDGSARDTGWFVFTDSSGASAPVVVPFKVNDIIPAMVLTEVLLGAAGLAVLLMFLVWRDMRAKPHAVTTDSTWSFGDSWASNLTGLGAVLGTVLAATGFLTEVLPGVSTGMFIGFSLLYGSLALLAPAAFTALCDAEGDSTYGGLLVAGAIVLWAVLGELGTAVVLLLRGGVPWLLGALACIAGVAGTFFYARASIARAIAPSPPQVDTDAAATSAAATAAAVAAATGLGGGVGKARSAALDAIVAAKAVNNPPKGKSSTRPAPIRAIRTRGPRSAML